MRNINRSRRDVRKSALLSVAITPVTLPEIILKSRDIKDDVRVAAFSKVARHLKLTQLAVHQRKQLLETGLKDRSKSVRDCCKGLLANWLRDVNDDPEQVRRLQAAPPPLPLPPWRESQHNYRAADNQHCLFDGPLYHKSFVAVSHPRPSCRFVLLCALPIAHRTAGHGRQ